jgi:hypothetical protein
MVLRLPLPRRGKGGNKLGGPRRGARHYRKAPANSKAFLEGSYKVQLPKNTQLQSANGSEAWPSTANPMRQTHRAHDGLMFAAFRLQISLRAQRANDFAPAHTHDRTHTDQRLPHHDCSDQSLPSLLECSQRGGATTCSHIRAHMNRWSAPRSIAIADGIGWSVPPGKSALAAMVKPAGAHTITMGRDTGFHLAPDANRRREAVDLANGPAVPDAFVRTGCLNCLVQNSSPMGSHGHAQSLVIAFQSLSAACSYPNHRDLRAFFLRDYSMTESVLVLPRSWEDRKWRD